ncbi:Roadblock/LC7 domain protein [uncultured archaeon]|nr:Roadblock/LC7 domain protein [uncultured archaeon]
MTRGKISGIYSSILLGLKNVDGVKLIALGNRDGFLIGEEETDEMEMLALMSATLLRSAEIITNRLEKTGPKHVIVDFKGGKLVAASAGQKALISVVAAQDADLDNIITELTSTAEKIKEIL